MDGWFYSLGYEGEIYTRLSVQSADFMENLFKSTLLWNAYNSY